GPVDFNIFIFFCLLGFCTVFSCGTIIDYGLGSVSTISCNGLEGRYVTILIPGRSGILTLCEVEVIAQRCIPPPEARNLALGHPATQSSTLEQSMAGKAVDGNCDGNWFHHSCTHTQNEKQPWWMVDLESQHYVSTVIVKNREDCCGERLAGAQIHVGDSEVDHGMQNPM
uniref:Fucolectin tachylectin-4 pentraxin-1 domain-containing protein n=1 Tax=Chelydra serpentina TaxID=8475 RepID=A0A8C3SEE8_CHESE